MVVNDHIPTVNDVELDSVVGVANAFSYLDDPWIAGHITVRSSDQQSSHARCNTMI